jgi:predicted dehydrogenase
MNASPSSPKVIRLAMLGMIPGNGHPYSWSAIVNGYDEKEMARCPYPTIPVYLAEGRARLGIPGAQVTHVWTDDPADAPRVAAAAKIPHVLTRPEDAIGEVDGVVIGTDDGADHARRARPFVEAGLPVFIDKPLASTLEELAVFVDWQRAGARILSSSGARYDPVLDRLRADLPKAGDLRLVSGVMVNTWERYGIHRVEPIFSLLGPGFESVALGPKAGRTEVAHLIHHSGVPVTIAMAEDAYGAAAPLRVVGNKASLEAAMVNTFDAFKGQMEAVVRFVRTGESPIPFAHTVEMMAVVIAGLQSRRRGGGQVAVAPLLEALRAGKCPATA